MGRAPSIQWYYKQWLGDQKVLGMDWDARAMHFHLLMMSIQEEPPGSLPNDMAVIRRWIGSPSDDVWRRVKPQVFSAWTFTDDRWFNSGMVETMQRAENYRTRYESGTKKAREPIKTKEEKILVVGSSKSKPSLEEVRTYCLERRNSVNPDKWFDFYQSKGWKIGNQAMKDWKAAVRTWEGRDVEASRDSKAQERVSRNRAAILEGLGYSQNARFSGAGTPPGSDAGRGPLLGGNVQERESGKSRVGLSGTAPDGEILP